MGRITKLVYGGVLTTTSLLCMFAVIAALDELARIPFYRTLPVAAAVVSSIALLLVLHKRRLSPSREFKSARRPQPLGGFLGNLPFRQPRKAVAKATAYQPSSTATPGPVLSSSQKTEGSLNKLHSVIWLPANQGRGKSFISQEELTNHETQQ